MYSLVPLLIHSHMLCSPGAQGDTGYVDYSIGASEPMRLTGAEFHAYENAWSVTFEVPDANSVLMFALCHEPCPAVSSHYRQLECSQMLSIVGDPQWHNEYMATHVADGQMLCEAIRSSPELVKAGITNVLSDSAGGALVRVRPPHTLVIFNEQEVMDTWMKPVGEEISFSFRATQLDVVAQDFGVRHFVHTVRLLSSTQRNDLRQGGLTFALGNGCTAIGLSAPDFGSVRGVSVGGRLRCVWECRGDMLRQPYNSEPPTVQQLNVSHQEYALLPVKYACLELPSAWVAVVFGFIVETSLTASDIGYAQALFDAVDRLALVVGREIASAGIVGIMIFSITDSVYHTSFADRIGELQAAACTVANVPDSTCTDGASTVTNPDYVYSRRLLSTSEAKVEGLFISDDNAVFSQPSAREQHLNLLRTVLVSAIVEHSGLLSDDNGSTVLRNIEDIDFSQIVSFTIPTENTHNESTVPKTAADDVENSLTTIASLLGGVIIFALCLTCICK